MSLGQFSSLSLPLALSALAQAAARALLQTAVLLRSRCDLAFSLRNSGLVAYSVLVAYCVLSSIAHCIALALRAPERARSSRTWESKTLSHKRAKSARILGFFRNPCKGWGFRFSFSCALGFSPRHLRGSLEEWGPYLGALRLCQTSWRDGGIFVCSWSHRH